MLWLYKSVNIDLRMRATIADQLVGVSQSTRPHPPAVLLIGKGRNTLLLYGQGFRIPFKLSKLRGI